MSENKSRKLTDGDFISASELVEFANLVDTLSLFNKKQQNSVDETFTIKPLEWVQHGNEGVWLRAWTPFGSYSIEEIEGVIYWEYCFDEHYDESLVECESVEHGKKMAWDHWQERIKGALSPVEKVVRESRS